MDTTLQSKGLILLFLSLERLVLYIQLVRDIIVRVSLRGSFVSLLMSHYCTRLVNSSIVNHKSRSNSEGLHTIKLLVTSWLISKLISSVLYPIIIRTV